MCGQYYRKVANQNDAIIGELISIALEESRNFVESAALALAVADQDTAALAHPREVFRAAIRESIPRHHPTSIGAVGPGRKNLCYRPHAFASLHAQRLIKYRSRSLSSVFSLPHCARYLTAIFACF